MSAFRARSHIRTDNKHSAPDVSGTGRPGRPTLPSTRHIVTSGVTTRSRVWAAKGGEDRNHDGYRSVMMHYLGRKVTRVRHAVPSLHVPSYLLYLTGTTCILVP